MISVILPAYNAHKYLREAVDSILNQTYKDFELIIIDDGSSDSSSEIIESYNDSRIRFFKNGENKGLIYTLNRGITLANGEYIARMDADDISLPTRFEKQVEYMDAHLECIVCGSFIQMFKDTENIGKPVGVFGDDAILKEYLFRDACFAHPSVMMRTECIKTTGIHYSSEFLHAEDYKFWVDLVPYGAFYNIPEVLLRYRVGENQVSQKYHNIQVRNSSRIRKGYIMSAIKNDEFLFDIENGITIDTIKKVKNLRLKTAYLHEILYLSLNRYRIREFMYLILSGDLCRISKKTALAFCKRALKGVDPLI